MTAHITKTRNGYQLLISATVEARDATIRYLVPNKREARKVCAALNAQPWNF